MSNGPRIGAHSHGLCCFQPWLANLFIIGSGSRRDSHRVVGSKRNVYSMCVHTDNSASGTDEGTEYKSPGMGGVLENAVFWAEHGYCTQTHKHCRHKLGRNCSRSSSPTFQHRWLRGSWGRPPCFPEELWQLKAAGEKLFSSVESLVSPWSIK